MHLDEQQVERNGEQCHRHQQAGHDDDEQHPAPRELELCHRIPAGDRNDRPNGTCHGRVDQRVEDPTREHPLGPGHQGMPVGGPVELAEGESGGAHEIGVVLG